MNERCDAINSWCGSEWPWASLQSAATAGPASMSTFAMDAYVKGMWMRQRLASAFPVTN